MQQRKRYSEEFKREAVGLTRLPGANVSQIARDLGIGANQLHRWRRELDASGKKAFPGNGVARDQEPEGLAERLPRMGFAFTLCPCAGQCPVAREDP